MPPQQPQGLVFQPGGQGELLGLRLGGFLLRRGGGFGLVQPGQNLLDGHLGRAADLRPAGLLGPRPVPARPTPPPRRLPASAAPLPALWGRQRAVPASPARRGGSGDSGAAGFSGCSGAGAASSAEGASAGDFAGGCSTGQAGGVRFASPSRRSGGADGASGGCGGTDGPGGSGDSGCGAGAAGCGISLTGGNTGVAGLPEGCPEVPASPWAWAARFLAAAALAAPPAGLGAAAPDGPAYPPAVRRMRGRRVPPLCRKAAGCAAGACTRFVRGHRRKPLGHGGGLFLLIHILFPRLFHFALSHRFSLYCSPLCPAMTLAGSTDLLPIRIS